MQLLESVPFVSSVGFILFLRSLTVAAHELINAASRIDKLALTCIERVRGVRNFDFYHRVSFAFEFYGVICLCGRTREEHIAVGHVLEHDGAIVFWMNTFFHFTCYLLIVYYKFALRVQRYE